MTAAPVRTYRVLARLAALLLLVIGTKSHADRRELYTLVSAGPAWISLDDPLTGTATTQQLGGFAGVLAYFGLTEALSVGGHLRLSGTQGVTFPGVLLHDPAAPDLSVTESLDHFAISATALVQFRLDTGFPLAPFVRVEGGGVLNRFVNLADNPDRTTLHRPYPALTELVPLVRGTLGLEYRFSEHWLLSLGVSYGRSYQTFSRWQLEVPLSFGFIWL
jgi:hypothetical protein